MSESSERSVTIRKIERCEHDEFTWNCSKCDPCTCCDPPKVRRRCSARRVVPLCEHGERARLCAQCSAENH